MSAKKSASEPRNLDIYSHSAEPYASVGQLLEQALAKALNSGVITVLGAKIKDAVGSAFDDIIHGNALNNILRGGKGNDAIEGGAGADMLYGEDGNDQLFGGEGNDALYGGIGKDVLAGGPGADRFVFARASESGRGDKCDVVTDFNGGEGDLIDLRPLLNSLKGVSSLDFIDNQPFTEKGQLRFEDGVLSGNFTGNLKSDFEVELIGVTSFSAEHLLVA